MSNRIEISYPGIEKNGYTSEKMLQHYLDKGWTVVGAEEPETLLSDETEFDQVDDPEEF